MHMASRTWRGYSLSCLFKTLVFPQSIVWPHSTLRKQIVSPKDPTPADKKSGVVYEIHCMNCHDVYFEHTGRQLGERFHFEHTGRQLGERSKEHKFLAPSRKLSAVAEHFSTTGHTIDWNSEFQCEFWASAESLNIFSRAKIVMLSGTSLYTYFLLHRVRLCVMWRHSAYFMCFVVQ